MNIEEIKTKQIYIFMSKKDEALEFTRMLVREARELEQKYGCDVEFQKHCKLILPDFLKKLKEDGVISTWSIGENADSITVNVPTKAEADALEEAWRNRSKRGGRREGTGPKKIDGHQHTWVVPSDIENIVKEKGTAYIWDAVRFKVTFDVMSKK